MKRIFLLVTILLSICSIEISAYVKYVTANLNLRYGPGTSYSVITVIPQGTPVTIDEDCDCKWVPVEYNGKIGYISTRYLSGCFSIEKTQSIRNSYTVRNKNISKRSPSYQSSGTRYYTNTEGYRVQSPTYYNSAPAGATALCRDGTYSFSRNRRGTCSHHGGVARWL